MKKFTTLLFDLDNTIFDFDQASKLAFQDVLERLDVTPQDNYFEQYDRINHAAWKALENGEITVQEVKIRRWKRFMSEIGATGNPLTINDFYLNQLPKHPIIIDGARELLEALKAKNYRLAAVTNGMKIVQRPRLQAANLLHYFESITVSEEIGISKPAKGFFDVAYQSLNYPDKEKTLMIGDSLSSDIQGGNNYGLPTCWYNPAKKVNNSPHIPTFEISDLEEIWAIIEDKEEI